MSYSDILVNVILTCLTLLCVVGVSYLSVALYKDIRR